MSVYSSWNYECTFPIGTRLDPKSFAIDAVTKIGDRMSVTCEDGDGGYASHILDDLIELFGKPLDEVPGLELHAWYRYEEDEYDEFTIDIKDGKVTCERTVKTWKPCTLDETDINIGHTKRYRP